MQSYLLSSVTTTSRAPRRTATLHLSSTKAPANTTATTTKSSALPVASRLTVPQSLACGAIARATAIFSMFPVDTIKTRMQVSSTTSAQGSSSASSLVSALGKGSLYRGVTVSLIGQVPYAMLSFGLYEILRSRVFEHPRLNFPDWLSITLAASIGDTIGSLWLTPTEVLKSKTQAGLFPGPFAAARGMASSGPGAFYQGYSAAIARDVPFRVLQLYLFERVRSWYISKRSTMSTVLSPLENLFVGAVSGTITGTLTLPFDVIRTRMMSQPVGQAALYRNALDCVVKTVKSEGLSSMMKGLGPRVVLIGPSSAVFFVAYEAVKSFFKSRGRRAVVQASHVTPLSARRRAARC